MDGEQKMAEEQVEEKLKHGYSVQLSGGYVAKIYRTPLRDDIVGVRREEDGLEVMLFIPRNRFGEVTNMLELDSQLVMITEGGPHDCKNSGRIHRVNYEMLLQSIEVKQVAPECYDL